MNGINIVFDNGTVLYLFQAAKIVFRYSSNINIISTLYSISLSILIPACRFKK